MEAGQRDKCEHRYNLMLCLRPVPCSVGLSELQVQQCHTCKAVYCSSCSVINYDEREDRIFCLDCNEDSMQVRQQGQHQHICLHTAAGTGGFAPRLCHYYTCLLHLGLGEASVSAHCSWEGSSWAPAEPAGREAQPRIRQSLAHPLIHGHVC